MNFILILEQMLNGLQLGVMLFLMAAGLTLVFGIMNLVNLAHGSLYMVGAYLATYFFGLTGSFLLGVVLGLLGTLAVGIIVELVALRTLYERDHLDQVLATFGLILFFNELVRVIWGPAGKSIAVPSFLNRTVEILRELQQSIREAIRDGFDPTTLEVEAHLRRAAPLACVVLPSLALAFAMIGPPFATLGQMILVSFALALAHGLLTALGASLGNGKVLPPEVAGWGPIAVVATSGLLIAWRARASVRG